MKILILAPHPFYQERGTPIAERLLSRALTELGHEVHLLAFPEGTDLNMPGLTIHRVRAPSFLHGIRPGFSGKKIVTDVLMLFRALWLARRLKPDVIHAVEESVFIAWAVKAILGIPYIYDMDSSVPDQIIEKFPGLHRWRGFMHRLFRVGVRPAIAVVPVCPGLARIAREFYDPLHLIELHDISLLDEQPPAEPLDLRKRLGIEGCTFMYIGNLEHYQGIDLLLEAFALHHRRRRQDALVVIGGPNTLVDQYKQRIEQLGCAGVVHFLGPQPTSRMPSYFQETDVLVSPRLKGVNTPMKLYSYLDSGRAVLATRLYTHTQVMTDAEGMLADASPEQLAEGMRRLAEYPDLRERLAREARTLIRRKHSYPVFKATVESINKLVAEKIAIGKRS